MRRSAREAPPQSKCTPLRCQLEACATPNNIVFCTATLHAMLNLFAPIAQLSALVNNSEANKLIVVATVMGFEECYLKEWLAFHFAQGIAQVYFMPSWYDAQPEAAGSFSPIRGLSTRMEQLTPRSADVHVLCDVDGRSGSCLHVRAKGYARRSHLARLLVDELIPRHSATRAALMVIDIDEFLTVPTAGNTLSGVLAHFWQLGASMIRVPERVYGANNVTLNPTCDTIRTFPTASEPGCYYNFQWKTIIRARPGWRVRDKTDAHELVQRPPSAELFTADGIRVRDHERARPCKSFDKWCKAWGPLMGGKHKWPLLQLRHYQTRSRAEWYSKMALYANEFRRYNKSSHSYTNPDVVRRRFAELDEPSFATGSSHRCKRERTFCRYLEAWPEACPVGRNGTLTEEWTRFVRSANPRTRA